jgi:hypothetical protein
MAPGAKGEFMEEPSLKQGSRAPELAVFRRGSNAFRRVGACHGGC